MHLLKGSSSRKINKEAHAGFSWQEGYSATTLRASDIPGVKEYIENQQFHHGENGEIDASLEDLPPQE